DKVEKDRGVSAGNLGLPQLPDGEFRPPMDVRCGAAHFESKSSEQYNARVITKRRVAHITQGTTPGDGRSTCPYSNRCMRGCPFGAYFSSNCSNLPAAEATGNMTLRPVSIVHEVIYDKESGKATGVRVIHAETKETF